MQLNKVRDYQSSPERNHRSLSDKTGFFILCILLLIQPFHFITQNRITYYREFFASLFLILVLLQLQKKGFSFFRRREVFFLILSMLYIVLAAFFDSGVNLYGDTDMTAASETLSYVNPTIYVLRNAFIYIPMVFYISLRGISWNEQKKICIIITMAAPLSIIAFLRYYTGKGIGEIGNIVKLGGTGLQYNTYVPYLTYAFITALFVSFLVSRRLFKIFYFSIAFSIFLYLLATASRQSVLFAILITMWIFRFLKSKKRFEVLLIYLAAAFVCLGLIISFVSSRYAIHSKLTDRFSSVQSFTDTNRIQIMKNGLQMLSTQQYVFGAGLSSVVVAGPHNDFIRWTQRIGVLGMLLSFAPFVLALKYNLKAIKKHNKSIYFLTSSGLFFTLYHSFFGYPRDNAYQSLYVFLGLALWLAVSRVESVHSRSERAGERGHASRNQQGASLY